MKKEGPTVCSRTGCGHPAFTYWSEYWPNLETGETDEIRHWLCWMHLQEQLKKANKWDRFTPLIIFAAGLLVFYLILFLLP